MTAARPRLLDLFCGAGGAAVGYHRAGFDVVGIDHRPQPRYPFRFWQLDVMTLEPWVLEAFDAVHASPPCEAYARSTNGSRSAGTLYPDLIPPTRALLEATGRPWLLENVPGAPMRADYVLCGCRFDLPLLQRERWFESSWRGWELRHPCCHTEPALSVTGHGYGKGNGQAERLREHLGRMPNTADARAAMGIDWMGRNQLAKAIPPAYTEHLGRYLLEHVNKGERHDRRQSHTTDRTG